MPKIHRLLGAVNGYFFGTEREKRRLTGQTNFFEKNRIIFQKGVDKRRKVW
jgi:hypothetical protein